MRSFMQAPHPSFDASVKIAEHVLLGVMVGLQGHCSLAAAIVNVGARISILESPFLVNPVSSSFFFFEMPLYGSPMKSA